MKVPKPPKVLGLILDAHDARVAEVEDHGQRFRAIKEPSEYVRDHEAPVFSLRVPAGLALRMLVRPRSKLALLSHTAVRSFGAPEADENVPVVGASFDAPRDAVVVTKHPKYPIGEFRIDPNWLFLETNRAETGQLVKNLTPVMNLGSAIPLIGLGAFLGLLVGVAVMAFRGGF